MRALLFRSARPARILCALAVFLTTGNGGFVRAETNAWIVHDSGLEREFVAALDEVAVRSVTGEFVVRAIAMTRSTADIRARAAAIERTLGREAQLVLYERDAPRSEYTRRITTALVLAALTEDADPRAIAAETGCEYVGPSGHLEGYHLFRATGPGAALDLTAVLRGRRDVQSAEPLLAKQQRKRGVPAGAADEPSYPADETGRPPDFKSIHSIKSTYLISNRFSQ